MAGRAEAGHWKIVPAYARRASARQPSLLLRCARKLVGSAGNAPVRHFRFCFL